MTSPRIATKFSLACLTAVLLAAGAGAQDVTSDDVLRKTATPFGPPVAQTNDATHVDEINLAMPEGAMKLPMAGAIGNAETPGLKPIAISKLSSRLSVSSLSDRLVSAKVYLPDHMVLGKNAEFTVRGKPGQQVALAMADKDTGASPIYGHKLRLGSDRKVVAIGTIDNDGSAKLVVSTPIQGDLVGQYLYFEAAVWTKSDFSDVLLAAPVALSENKEVINGVLVQAETGQKKRLQFMTAPAMPMGQTSDPSNLNSGQP